MTALIDGAKREGVRRNTPIEAYPIDPVSTGRYEESLPRPAPTFLGCGFSEVGRLSNERAVVRSD